MKMENSVFYQKKSINCRGKLLNIEQPVVMGIINVTPDSFYDGGVYENEAHVLKKVEQMVQEGVSIVDIGAYSTRPGAKEVSVEEELGRLLPIIKVVRENYPDLPISADTFRAHVAREAVKAGASMVNDISGGTMDEKMFETIADINVPYILMHINGTPDNMQEAPYYENVVIEIMDYLIERVYQLRSLGVNDIIIDPGFGFGKTLEHNYVLLKKLALFKMIDCPILCGLSRKSMVNKVLDIKAEEALNGTVVLNTIALMNGANILRVHDVKEALEAIKLVNYLQKV